MTRTFVPKSGAGCVLFSCVFGVSLVAFIPT